MDWPVDDGDRRLRRRGWRGVDNRSGTDQHGGDQRGDQRAASPKRAHKFIVGGYGAHARHSKCA